MEKNGREDLEMEEKSPSLVVDGDVVPEITYNGVKTMPFIIGNETFEKLGAIGTLSNLQVYLTTVFNMRRISATTLLNVFNGTTNLATLVGAYLSDTHFGRYKTLGFASVASFFGLLSVCLTAVFKNLHPPHCDPSEGRCEGPDAGQMAFLLFGFALMIVGAGGIRPCNLAFGADQFNPNTDSGKRGVDSFFNWYYFTVTFAGIVSVTIVVYVQSNVSWSIGLAIPAIFMFLSCFLYFVGSKLYVKVLPEGSPMTSLVQVFVVALKKRKLKLPNDPWISLFNYTPPKSINSNLPYTEQFRFLDKAAIITGEDQINPNGTAANPWNLCSIQQIEEAKCVLRVIPVSLVAIMYHLGAQQQYIVFQALQSDRHLGNTKFEIPAATYVIFAMLSLTLWVPLYDRLIVPSLRRITGIEGGITTLHRMGIGIFITIVESIIGALVEERRRNMAGTGMVSPMSSMWLVPQLALGGIAEAFFAIAQLEFFYKQFPENMRSVAGAFFFCGYAVSNYVYSLLLSVVHHTTEGTSGGNWLPEDLNKGRLDYFYYLVAVLCSLNFVYFLVCARWYRYKGDGDNRMAVEMEAKKLENHSA
ncbi:putative peptide/nitrate transporter-like [Dorcoceras hygrometricum]|uniref:Putative peptide/nitrate transporter-like n=1 Tax=Dorcoceras hygrometricum TaxID=472368 RepID=A0A2Z7D9F1_9LAMI|nr:putative peptide/nitrate transporter-like [Dorcoceras hygrometricum]